MIAELAFASGAALCAGLAIGLHWPRSTEEPDNAGFVQDCIGKLQERLHQQEVVLSVLSDESKDHSEHIKNLEKYLDTQEAIAAQPKKRVVNRQPFSTLRQRAEAGEIKARAIVGGA
jgi:hypothetical protein